MTPHIDLTSRLNCIVHHTEMCRIRLHEENLKGADFHAQEVEKLGKLLADAIYHTTHRSGEVK